MSSYKYQFLIEPAMQLANQLDIGDNPDPNAIYEAMGGCIQVWATPEDHPKGDWNQIHYDRGAFSKPCKLVGTISWEWDEAIRNIVAIEISSHAYALSDQLPEKYTQHIRVLAGKTMAAGFGKLSIYNREDDLDWVEAKTKALFGRLGLWGLVPVKRKAEKS